MKLLIKPAPPLAIFSKDLELVISVSEQGTPDVFVKEGLARPDRHFLLGLAQRVGLALEEADPEFAAFMETESIALENSGSLKELPQGLIVARDGEGHLGGIAVPDARAIRALARGMVRYFTGTIRLDIP
jgi:hypothetical protein